MARVAASPMLFRFSLYGFLKNQRYFEPFLILALLERDCSFTQIGMLVALRELVLQVFEMPSGALADTIGRRKVMVGAFLGYVAAYLLLGLGSGFPALAAGMGLIGFGDAFRSGTHKAMIFDWLRRQGRSDDKVKVYGYTRSWSKIGSAVAIPVAAVVVMWTGRYADVFVLSALPSALDALNLATYPRELDGLRQTPADRTGVAREAFQNLRTVARKVWTEVRLRRRLLEAMIFGGTYKATKDYVQPLLVGVAAAVWVPDVLQSGWDLHDRTSVAAGGVYIALFSLSAVASRNAHRFVSRFDTVGNAVVALWWMAAAVAGLMLIGLLFKQPWLSVLAFIGFGPLFDVFRPTLVSRIDDAAGAEAQATVLSLESQVTSAATAVVALVTGALVDVSSTEGTPTLWPVPAVALALIVPAALRTTAWARVEPATEG